ncbi:ParB/RepB/Spo0J family partition protein [Streptomyces kronopolitis]|uniref:ParB/RepB/Spo0J family partition protein n=1 Tax=Streptomyces kronopolitis TaxID=1612435 RepID=UPI003D987FD8
MPTAAAENGDALELDVADISANPYNDRDLGDVSQLGDSIKRDGLLQDIAVMHTAVFAKHYPEAAEGITTKYVLAFGERRWRAHIVIGEPKIQAILRDDVADRIRRVLFIENFHRKQLSPIEEARKFKRLNVEEGMSYREIVEELHLGGPNHVARRLELLKLPTALQEIVGTEDGPGVTVARNLLAKLADPDDQIAAWELIRDNDLTVNAAVQAIRDRTSDCAPEDESENVPEDDSAPVDEAKPATGQPGEAEADAEQPKDQEKAASAENGSAKNGDDRPAATPAPRKNVGGKVTAADKDTVERNHASADRDSACQGLVSADQKLSVEQHNALYARTLLAPMQQSAARTRAHRWLREAERAEFTISDTDSYFEAVLSSGKAELINRVTLATALAAGEIRARDGRRQWDRTDAEHVGLLIETTGYVPETAWERAQLTKHDIAFPGAENDPDPEPIN